MLLALGIVAVAGALLARWDTRWDWTADARWTPSPTTRAILAAVKENVQVTAFFRGGTRTEAAARLRERLEIFRRRNPNLEYRFVDPLAEPTEALAYGVTADGTVVAEAGTRREIAAGRDETDLAAALVRLLRSRDAIVAFVEGHGERTPSDETPDGISQAVQALRDAGVTVTRTLLLREEEARPVPDILVLAGPKIDLLPAEVDRLNAHLDAGQAVLVLIDPRELPNLEGFLAGRGVVARRDVVVDPSTRLYGTDATVPVVTDYGPHAVTEPLRSPGVTPTFFPVARSLQFVAREGDRSVAEAVARTGPRSWGERAETVGSTPPPRRDGEEPAGPLTIAFAVHTTPKGRLLVVGDSDFAANGNFGLSGNGVLFARSVEWLAGEEDEVPIPSPAGPRPLLLTGRQVLTRVTLPSLALPVLVSIIALAGLFRRRS
jgi:ABC-type uncharacterized transport system involved in gliding motility auxiliary subunit